MSVTVSVVDDPNVRVSDESIAAVPPDTVEFVVEGTITVSRGLLGRFRGRSLRPVAVGMTADDAQVTLDLRGDAALRLDAVDVGVETPDADGLPSNLEGLESITEGVSEATDREAGVVAFTVEGSVTDVPPDAFEVLSGELPRFESITFAVDDVLVSDGGTGDDVVFEIAVLGFGVVIRRDGTVTVE